MSPNIWGLFSTEGTVMTLQRLLEIWLDLDIAGRALDEVVTPKLAEGEITPIEACILLMAMTNEEGQLVDGMMASHLAKAVGRAATSFTPILDKIEKKGLIERRQHLSDRRAVQIFFTEKGRIFFHEWIQRIRDTQPDLEELDKVTTDKFKKELKTFITVARKLAK